jgi:hypothetical protein
MHLELPKVRLESLKDFLKHYLMIVLSILTALGLEAWIEHTHHRHAAATASAEIEAEIQGNLEQIEHIRAHDLERMHALEAVRDGLLHDIQAHDSDAVCLQHAQARMPDGLYLDYRWPVLRHEAWSVAVANQSAGWIDSARLRRYSTVYALQDASAALMTADMSIVLDGPRMNDAMIDLQTGSLTARELLHVVNQMAGTVNEAVHNLDSLDNRIRQAMGSAKHTQA